MAYQVSFKPSFFKDLKSVPKPERVKFEIVIDRIIEDPFSVNAKKLSGYSHLYRYRLGDYRLVYYVQQNREKIIFLLLAHRKDIYRHLKNLSM